MPVKDLTRALWNAYMLSLSKPLQEFYRLDKCLSKHGTRFGSFVNDKEIICYLMKVVPIPLLFLELFR